MLHYAGPNIGSTGPVTNMLPPAVPGTIPSGVPGISPSPIPLPPVHTHAIHVHTGPHPAALAAILRRSSPGAGAPPPPPPPPDYGTTTQEDGSILLHLKNPDGSLGPIVKVLPPIKRPEANNK